MQPTTLAEILKQKAALGNAGITFIEQSNREEFLSYGELYGKALKGLAFLQRKGLQPKDELVLQLDDNKTLLIVFWACLLGGIIPVPLTVGQSDDHKQKLFNVWPVLNNPFYITSPEHLVKLAAFARSKAMEAAFAKIEAGSIEVAGLLASASEGRTFDARREDIAFIQFSSGSTGSPKGVVLTHRNLLTNIEAISRAAGYSQADVLMSWMPLSHDMGMIGFHLNPLCCGINQYHLATGSFIRRPALWLDKATEHGVSVLCSPNFGYRYVLRHCFAGGGKEQTWDLSRVRLLYNGAEPISESLCHDFVTALARYGLDRRAMRPVYGLAEASLAVSISPPGDEVAALHLDRNKLNVGDEIAANAAPEHAVAVVNVGKPVDNCLVRITAHGNAAVGEGVIGHVQIKGDSVTAGYYNNAAATQQAISTDGWLGTGDLGFKQEGALYITGRSKDIIISNGQNYYPHDIEQVAEAVDGIELNKIAVAGFFNSQTEKEETIAFVFHRAGLKAFMPVVQSLKALVSEKTGLEVHRVIPVKDIPRTTSGKLQRFKLLQAYQDGYFQAVEAELEQLGSQAGTGTVAGVAPANDKERKLAGMWARLLNGNPAGVTQTFFESGGNSLKAAELGMLVQKEFGVELPLELLYANPTVRQCAEAIGNLEARAFAPIPVAPEAAYYPLTTAQKRLYYAWEVNKTTVAYNLPVAFGLHGEVQTDRLEMCIRQLIRRHDALRMAFRATPEPGFTVHERLDFTLGHTRCRRDQVKEKLRAWVQPFDLAEAPLFRVAFVETDDNERLLLLDFHHIVSDGLSVYHFMNELLALYAGAQLPELPIGYKDYACWEKAARQPEKTKRQEQYWLERLRGQLPVLQLPLDYPRPVVFSPEGEKIPFAFSKETTAKLKHLAQANQCTLHVLLFTLYNVLLWKYTGQEDLVVGIPVAGRTHPDLQNVQGMFVNNLAIRSTIRGEESFIQLLEKQQHTLLKALENQAYHFEALIGRVAQTRDVSRNLLFDTMFVYQNMGLPGAATAPFTLSRYFFDPGFSKYDLSLEVFEDEDTIRYGFEYATRLLKRETVLRLATHFENLAGRVLDAPTSKVSDVSPLADSECDEYISRFNRTQSSYPRDQTVHALFEEQAQRTPGRTAVAYQGRTFTYAQLNDRANALAARLREYGIGPNRLAAILLERSPEFVISVLAVLKAGGGYLPVDVELPAERIGYLLTDSQCGVVITTAENGPWPALRDCFPDVPVLDPERPEAYREGAGNVPGTSAPGDLAYTIYTSGTTGRPKGVMIEHRSLVNYISWAGRHYVKDQEAAFPLYTSVSFDLTVTSIFTPLLTGNRLVVYGAEGTTLLLEQVVADNQADVIKLTPSHLKLLREMEIAPAQCRLKRLIVGGEQLETQLAREIHDKFAGRVEIYNEYGPTEATVGCMIHRFDPEERLPNVPIGVPAANTQLYILDAFLKPVPVGVSGELYVAGDGLGRGYLGAEELTRQKFIPNPFAQGQRMYKTGDLVRRLPAGTLAFIGRSDQQVKLNGYRIELTEIEGHLASHPEIAEALVRVKAAQHRKYLCAYYRPVASGAVIDDAELRNYLAGRLPHYMMPARFVLLQSIPLTHNGKVDEAALPEPAGAAGAAVSVRPGNGVEALMLPVWEEVLGKKNLRVTDNFFELGGDSIKAVQIASRLFEKGISVDVKAILTYHTIAHVSQHAAAGGPGRTYPQGIATGERGLLPIEAWFFSRRFEHPHYYNQSVRLKLHKKVNPRHLAEAFRELIRHHDGLRTNYDPAKGVMFYNNRHLEANFVVEEIAATARAEDAAGQPPAPDALAPYVRLKGSFDLARSLLLRAALVGENDGPGWLFITAHHLVTDGVSWRILLEDLYALYNARQAGNPVALPAKTASLTEWVHGLHQLADSAVQKAGEDYWRDLEMTPFAIPQDFETGDWQVAHLDKVVAVLEPEKTAFLLGKAHLPYRTDVPVLLNTALALTLGEWTGQDRFVIEYENHGRHLETIAVSRTTGWFTAMYPVKLELKKAPLGDQIKSIKEQLSSVPGHGLGYGLWKYSGAGAAQTRSENPLPALRFNYLGQFDKELDNDLFSYSPEPTGSDVHPGNAMTARLELNAMVTGGVLHLEVIYNRKAHLPSTIAWFTQAFFRHLSGILHHVGLVDGVSVTPSDFSAVTLTDEDLVALFG